MMFGNGTSRAKRWALVSVLCLGLGAGSVSAQDDDVPPDPSNHPPAPTGLEGVRATDRGLELAVSWGEAVPEVAAVRLVDGQGRTFASATARAVPGEIGTVEVPMNLAALAGQWRFGVVIDGTDAAPTAFGTVDVELDCANSKRRCTARLSLGGQVSNAIAVSDALREALDRVSGGGNGRTNLVDTISGMDPSLRGEAIRYADEVATARRGGGSRSDCDCYWTQNGPRGFKLPTPANNLFAIPQSHTMAFGLEGPGAVLYNGAHHSGTTFSGTRDLTTEAEGSTVRKVQLDCFMVTAYEIYVIEIDINGDGIIDFVEEVEVPSEWGPCDKEPCDSRVDVLGLGAAQAYTYTWNRGLFVRAESWADAWLDMTVQAANVMSLHADSYSTRRADDLDVDENIHVGTYSAPLCLEFEADSRSRVRGRARDINWAVSTTGYAYALYGQASCAVNGPLVSFEAVDYTSFIPDFCANIDTFYTSRGISVSCP